MLSCDLHHNQMVNDDMQWQKVNVI